MPLSRSAIRIINEVGGHAFLWRVIKGLPEHVELSSPNRRENSMRLQLLATLLLLSACASAPKYTWTNPSLAPVAMDGQRQIDSAECTAIAMQGVPLPTMPSETNINVNVDQFGGHMTETGTEIESRQIDLENKRQAQIARRNLAEGCMLKRGWIRTALSTTESSSSALKGR